MRQPASFLLLLLSLCAVPQLSQAQTAPPKASAASDNPADAVVQVKLGVSAAELAGLWKFHIGDDPAWARPDFNDSTWGTIDLTVPETSATGAAPGWTAQGFPNHSGYAWYRLHVNLESGNRALSLKMPDSADDAYQVYVNGTQIGEFGKFGEHHVTAYSTLPNAFRLPKDARNGLITIAVRTWMDSATPFSSPDAGGMRGPPEIGYASVIATQIQMDWDEIAHEVGSGFLEILILVMALLMAVTLFWLDRAEKSYLWLVMVCAVTLLGNATVLLVNFTTAISLTSGVILTDVVLTPLRIGIWVLFWGYWFRLKRMGTLHKSVWPLVILLGATMAMLRAPLFGQVVPVHAGTYLQPFSLALKLLLAALLLLVAYYGFKRQKTEGFMALVAMVLSAVAYYQHELRLIHVKTTFSVLHFHISLGTVSTILSLLIITILLLRRFIWAQRLREQWKLEIQQAREIQQVLIPATLPHIQGLIVESEYRPAREVGGDFFQILPGDAPGTALVVVGDVTGKGMQAGMLVALILGSIRTAARHSSDPGRILALANEELCSREQASATCMVLKIGRDGDVQLANAGQLPPYLNGIEVEIEGALPLGIVAGIEYPVTSFSLLPGDALILMSDGVAEAQDAHGKLFGFERVDELLSKPVTAKEIAAAAQKFGQEDDILVLRIQREMETGPDPRPAPQLVNAS